LLADTAHRASTALHGGVKGFSRKVGSVAATEDGLSPAVTLALHSPNGDEGDPGALDVQVTYRISGPRELTIDYRRDLAVDRREPDQSQLLQSRRRGGLRRNSRAPPVSRGGCLLGMDAVRIPLINALSILTRIHTATPKAGLGFELDVIAACFVGGASAYGGVGRVGGAVIGALIMGVMNNGMSILGIGIDYQQVIKGLVLLGAVCLDVYNQRR
jgi:hypothetical protein